MFTKAICYALVPLLALLSGCGGSTIHKSFSIDGAQAKSISVDAKQRAILVTYDRGSDEKGKTHVVCAEPSPDAMVAAASSIAGNANILGYGDGGLSSAISETATNLGLRTDTIQLLRDGLYRACEAYMNGAIDKRGYGLILRGYDDAMVTLLAIESITGIKAPATVIIAAGLTESEEQRNQNVGDGGELSASEGSSELAGASLSEAKAESDKSIVSEGNTAKVDKDIAEIVGQMLEKYLDHQIQLIKLDDSSGGSH